MLPLNANKNRTNTAIEIPEELSLLGFAFIINNSLKNSFIRGYVMDYATVASTIYTCVIFEILHSKPKFSCPLLHG